MIRLEIQTKFVQKNEFTLQRYKLREMLLYLPKAKGLSLIRHVFECNYEESEAIRTAFLEGNE